MHILSFCSLIDPKDVINPDAFKSVVAAVNAAQSAKTLACLPKIPQCVWGCLPPNIDLDHLFAPIVYAMIIYAVIRYAVIPVPRKG